MNEALAAFRAAQDVDPNFVYARFCESNLYLMQGDFTRGYALYDAHRAVYPHRHRERRWDGRPRGRTRLSKLGEGAHRVARTARSRAGTLGACLGERR